MDLEHLLCALVVGYNHYVRFFAHADACADTVYVFPASISVQGEVVQAAVGQAVAVVLGFLDLGDQTDFGEGRDGFSCAAGAAAQAGDLLDERRRD